MTADCIFFKPQRTDAKHHGCVQPAPCEQCGDCVYIAPGGGATDKPKAEKKKKK